jgi:hypothetical protein
LLCSLGAWIVCGIGSAFSDSEKGAGCFAIIIALLSGVAGCLTGIMALVLFVKWVWYS